MSPTRIIDTWKSISGEAFITGTTKTFVSISTKSVFMASVGIEFAFIL